MSGCRAKGFACWARFCSKGFPFRAACDFAVCQRCHSMHTARTHTHTHRQRHTHTHANARATHTHTHTVSCLSYLFDTRVTGQNCSYRHSCILDLLGIIHVGYAQATRSWSFSCLQLLALALDQSSACYIGCHADTSLRQQPWKLARPGEQA